MAYCSFLIFFFPAVFSAVRDINNQRGRILVRFPSITHHCALIPLLGLFSTALIDGGLELDDDVDWDTAHLTNPCLELDLGNPDNVISWDVLRRLLGGTNFAPSYYDRGQFFLTFNFALECGTSFLLMLIRDPRIGWRIEDHPEVFFPLFIRSAITSFWVIKALFSARAVNNFSEDQAMAMCGAGLSHHTFICRLAASWPTHPPTPSLLAFDDAGR